MNYYVLVSVPLSLEENCWKIVSKSRADFKKDVKRERTATTTNRKKRARLCCAGYARCTFSMKHKFMLSNTENGRMFYFNSFHTQTKGAQNKEVKKTTESGIAKNSIKRECERVEKHLRTQQFRKQQSNVFDRGEILPSPDARHMQHAMCC